MDNRCYYFEIFDLDYQISVCYFVIVESFCQVWSLVRRFDQPQRYKPFVSRCMMQGDFAVGCLRQVNIKSGLPATTSTERLEQLDDNERILSIKIVGGDHKLQVFFFLQPSSVFFLSAWLLVIAVCRVAQMLRLVVFLETSCQCKIQICNV